MPLNTLHWILVALITTTFSYGMSVNRINGGGTMIYVDFSIPGPVVPLELTRTYNTITALSENAGWRGAFGWGWTSPFETSMTTTADRQVVMRDGETGGIIVYRPEKPNKHNIDDFLEKFKAAYFKQNKGKELSEIELAKQKLPTALESKLRADARYRIKMSQKFHLAAEAPEGQLFVSSEYGYQSIRFQNGEWTREKAGIVQVFDEKGRLRKFTDKSGTTFHYQYPSNESLQISEIHDSNKSMSLKFKWEVGHVVQVIDNKGTKATYHYDASNNLVSITDSSGKTYNYRYENKKFPHALTRVDYPDESKPGANVYREFGYDVDGLVTHVRNKEGDLIEYQYGRNPSDPENNFWTKIVTTSGSKKIEDYVEYEIKKKDDGSKYLARQVTKLGSKSTTTIFSPSLGQPLELNENGVVTKFTYFPDGTLKTRVTPRGTVVFEYDPRWRKASKVTQPGLVSNFTYDGKGNLISAKNSNKQFVNLTYDSFGRIKSLINEQKRNFSFEFRGSSRPEVIVEAGVGSIELNYARNGQLLRARALASKNNKLNPQKVVEKAQEGLKELVEILRPIGLADYHNGNFF